MRRGARDAHRKRSAARTGAKSRGPGFTSGRDAHRSTARSAARTGAKSRERPGFTSGRGRPSEHGAKRRADGGEIEGAPRIYFGARRPSEHGAKRRADGGEIEGAPRIYFGARRPSEHGAKRRADGGEIEGAPRIYFGARRPSEHGAKRRADGGEIKMIDRIIEYSARNRFLVVLLVAFATAAGVWSLRQSPLDAIPDLSDVQVIIFTDWPGRSPDIVEDQITYPIISTMIAAPRVNYVRGESMLGYSFVNVVFQDGTDLYWARSRVLEYMQGITGRLPEGVSPRLGPDATGVGWVYEYALVDRSGTHTLADLRSFQDWHLRYWLEAVPGVAEVASVGGFVKQYQVEIKPATLLAFRLPFQQVMEAIRRSNNEVGGRLIEFNGTEYMVRGRGYVRSVDDVEKIVVGTNGSGTPISIRDIGTVHLGPDLRRGLVELDGNGEVVGGVVVMRQGENALRVIDGVKRKLAEVEKSLPPGVEVVATYDRSDAHPPRDRHAEAHARRGARDRQPGDPRIPLAHPERRDPDRHDPDRRPALVHSDACDGHHGEHHVARRDRGGDRRHGRCRDRRRRADAQEARAVAVRRPPGELPRRRRRRREGSRRPQLLLAAGDRRLVSADLRARGAGRPALQAARVHQELLDRDRRPAGDHPGSGGAPHLHARRSVFVPAALALSHRQCRLRRHDPQRGDPSDQPAADAALPAGDRGRAALSLADDRRRHPRGRGDGADLLPARFGIHAAPQRRHDSLHADGAAGHVDHPGARGDPDAGSHDQAASRGGERLRQIRPRRDADRSGAAQHVRDGRDAEARGSVAAGNDLGQAPRRARPHGSPPRHAQHLVDAHPDADGNARHGNPQRSRDQGVRRRSRRRSVASPRRSSKRLRPCPARAVLSPNGRPAATT